LLIGNQRFFVDVSTESLQNYKVDSAQTTLVQAGTNARGFLNIKALINGTARASLLNGQLQAMVNGQLLAMVNGQTMPILNGQLMAMVNGQLQAMVNGQLVAMVNGQLMALVNGELEFVQGLTLVNGQLQAIINGQLQALVNGQLKAMVNGVVTNIPTDGISVVNGQLQAMVNGQLQAMVNGQLQALVNGEESLVNGAGVAAESVRQLANGQLQALVNDVYIPIANGQLVAMVNDLSQPLINGQLLAMVNGQLMAIVNGEVTFAVFVNGQLQAMVNGQLQALVNGQLKAMVNGELQTVNSYSIVNGQLQALVNGETWVYANGQLLALVNGQLQALVNNFDVSGANNNANTLVLVDEDDIILQAGSIGGMFSMNMITGLDAGIQNLVPGAFVNENFEVTYGLGQITILQAPLTVKANDTTKVYGEANPEFTVSYSGLAYDDDAIRITPTLVVSSTATANTSVGIYPITVAGGSSTNYTFASYLPGNLTITKKALLVKADDKTKIAGDPTPPLTITYNGLVGDDTKESVCIPYVIPTSPKVIKQLNRSTTYTDVKLNGGTNFINATPGQSITLTGNYNSVYSALYNEDGSEFCPGCITQIHIGLSDGNGGNVFNDCIETNSGQTPQPSGTLNRIFSAPKTPGVYYLTQESTWWFYCGQFADPVHINAPNDAIAVVVVNVSNESITASTTTDVASPPGSYPITLQGCNTYSPNYDVTLQDGILSIITTTGAVGRARSKRESVITEVSSGDKLYPNPAFSTVRLELEVDVQQSSGAIQVYDIVGKLNRISVKRKNENIYDIDVSVLSKGVYFIKVKTSDGLRTFRFVKL
jgi:hypothetical protein